MTCQIDGGMVLQSSCNKGRENDDVDDACVCYAEICKDLM